MSLKYDFMKSGGIILKNILLRLSEEVKPGITTKQLEVYLKEMLLEYKVISGTKNLNGFPSFICISVNEELLSGVPSSRVIRKGDIVKLDLTINYKGFYVDKAVTVLVEPNDYKQKYILKCAQLCLDNALRFCKEGISVSELGDVIQTTANFMKVKVVKDYGGHGVGYAPHMEPFIPNYCNNDGTKLYETYSFTIEPVVVFDSVTTYKKGMTVMGDPISAHVEETVLLTENGYEVLTR